MLKHRLISILLIFWMLLISSCGPDKTEEELRLQLTVQALQMTQSALSDQPQKEVNLSPTVTVNIEETDEEGDDVPEEEDSEDEIPCHASRFVSETIPDGSAFDPGETFVKTWTLRNAGTCNWTEDYSFEFEQGTRMGGESLLSIDKVIKPNDTITFNVNLTAPATDGEYTGVWRMVAADGEKMGQYWVKIRVGSDEAPPPDEEPSTPFAVTRVSFPQIDPILAICPSTLGVVANITVNKAGTVTYRWEDNKGGTESGSITFGEAGTKSVHHSIPIPSGGDGIYSAKIYIDEPNHQSFGSIEVEVDCS